MKENVIVRNIPRSERDSAILDEVSKYGVATLSESQAKKGVLDPSIRPIQEGRKIAGTAITVQCFDADNLMIHAALELCHKGDILVVVSLTETKNGYFGELLARAFLKRGVTGLIIDGGVRDVQSLRQLGFPVWSRYINVVGTTKNSPGSVNIPITCGNVMINPGDFVVADDDGIVSISREDIDSVIKNSREREKRETLTREKIANGELSVDFYNLRERIQSIGVTYVDNMFEGK